MKWNWLCAVALATVTSAAAAQQDAQNELEQLKKRVEELEKRAPAAGTNAFNPDISVILQGTAATSSQDPNKFQITGFAPTGGEVAPPRRGFSLGESELVITSNIDPYFRGQLVASLTPENELEVEEAFFQTLALGRGFTMKGGRFLSGIGYLNPIHQHAWDFQDAPLPYKAFLGGRLDDDAVQVKWIAPTDLLVELGAEAGRGRSFPANDPNRNGAGLWTLYGHVGGDLGESTAWRAGLSYLRASPSERPMDGASTFSGRSSLWIADFIAKWAPNGNSSITNLKLQGEYFRRTENGDATFAGAPGGYESRQSGWYAQTVYQFMPRWRVAYRYDRLDHGTVSPLFFTDYTPSRNTLMADWSPTEFSRIRLQLAADKSRAGVTDKQVLVQYIFSLGAHGAHTF